VPLRVEGNCEVDSEVQGDAAVEIGSSLEMWHVIEDWLGEVQTGAGLAKPATYDLEVPCENRDYIDLFFSELNDLLKHHE
jgi:hypothetical protein